MIFISAPAANFDGSGRLTTLADAVVSARSRFTPAVSGDFRLIYAAGASAAFTTTGANAVLGGAVSGASETAFIIAPSANLNAADELTSLTGCVLSASKNITGLLGGTSYRAIVLSAPSGVFTLEIPAEWVIVDTVIEVAPTPFAAATPIISGGVLSGPAGIYRVVNATVETDIERSLTPPTTLSSISSPGDSLTIYHLQFSSESPEVIIPISTFTATETWSSYANGNTFTQLDTNYARTNANIAGNIATNADGPAGLGCSFGITSGAEHLMMNRDDITAELATRLVTERVNVLVKMRTASINTRHGFGWSDGTNFTGFRVSNFSGTNAAFSITTAGNLSTGTNTTDLLTGQANDAVFWLRFEVEGAVLRGRVWADGAGEPGTWTNTRTHGSDLVFDKFGPVVRTGNVSTNCLGYSIGINVDAPSF